MAIDDLPTPVVNFLNVIGIKWPYIDEGTVMQFASLVREFGTAVATTTETLRAHAQAIRSHAATVQRGVVGLGF